MKVPAHTIDNPLVDLIKDVNRYITGCQKANGAIPWFSEEKLDPWDHTEAAMGLTIGGNFEAARKAFRWLINNQNADGSWYAAYYGKADNKDHQKIETNFIAYPACGLWHYYLVTQDIDFVHECMPCIVKAIEYVLSHQTPEGDIQWAVSEIETLPKDALVTACSSIVRSLECAIALAKISHNNDAHWVRAYHRLADALRNKPWRFDRSWEAKTRFSMDWFYPVISGVLSQDEAQARLDARWKEFIEDDYGCRCVSDEPWMTVAESCELCISLVASGRKSQAREIFTLLLKWQDDDGGFWTGYSFRDHVIWPKEKTTWTAAAILLAADAIEDITPAAHVFTQKSTLLPPDSD